jgi:hypothetical protein
MEVARLPNGLRGSGGAAPDRLAGRSGAAGGSVIRLPPGVAFRAPDHLSCLYLPDGGATGKSGGRTTLRR